MIVRCNRHFVLLDLRTPRSWRRCLLRLSWRPGTPRPTGLQILASARGHHVAEVTMGVVASYTGNGVGRMLLIARQPGPRGYQMTASRSRPKVGEFLGAIQEIVVTDRTAHPKQQHTSRRLFERLRDDTVTRVGSTR
jgi:hypothetical protein